MKKRKEKKGNTRLLKFLSLYLVLTLLMTGITFIPGNYAIAVKAARRHPTGDIAQATVPKINEPIILEGKEAKKLQKQLLASPAYKLGEYANLLSDFEKDLYKLYVKTIFNAAPNGTTEKVAKEKYTSVVEVSAASYNALMKIIDNDDNWDVEYQHIWEASYADYIDKVEPIICDIEGGITPISANGKYYFQAYGVTNYAANPDTLNAKLENAANRFLASIKNGTSDAETELLIHDALIDNITYDDAGAKDGLLCHTAYAALVEGLAVCDGYSSALSYLLKKKNIDSLVMSGMAGGGGHAWNRVKLGSDWYEVDLTWDDSDDPNATEEARHEFFNITTSKIENLGDKYSHLRKSPYIGELMDSPEATGTTYNYEYMKEHYPYSSVKATKITTDITSKTLKVGESVTATATLTPSDATNKYVKWLTSDSSVADVDGGVITGIHSGTATITAVAGSDNKVIAPIQITVYQPVTGLTLDKTNLSLRVGETAPLTSTIIPADADDKTVTWSSSDEAVATVANGTITAVKTGTATITATSHYDNSITATCKVTVIIPVAGLTLDKNALSLKVGEAAILTPTITPENADDKTIIWTSSNEAVATVANGTVTAIGSGTAVIKATSNENSSIAATCSVTVSKAAGADITTGTDKSANTFKVISGSDNNVSYTGNGNKKATSLSIPSTVSDENGITYTVTEIGAKALKGRSKLKKLTIPATVTTIRSKAFSGCKKLEKITINGNNLKTIESGAFSGISKNAKFTIKTSSKSAYKTLVKRIKKCGGKNATFKWKKS
ncbi:Ig-like domain-containing protein [Butyrivibrio sp. AE3004]|uniref:Ig-like domain-containing protein n=1 Tax=Butyrivibrio sp. AE3004 TaxID=1506994 RepID=UPI0006908C33|nr:Ig-like domain-containing protein [Butyrivibrio sp. AE3004]